MVMSLARCISAISVGDLIIRQPAVTGVARTTFEAGAACAMPSAMKKRTRSSTPILRRRHAAILQDAQDRRAPILVFLPDADVLGERRDLSRARLLEAGADVGELALLRE